MATTVAQLRLLMGDPSGATAILTDDEYSTIITIEPQLYRAAALAARTLAAYFAQKVATAIDSTRLDLQQKFEHYLELSKLYDTKADEGASGVDADRSNLYPTATGISVDAMDDADDDDDRPYPAFHRNLHRGNYTNRVDEDDNDYSYD